MGLLSWKMILFAILCVFVAFMVVLVTQRFHLPRGLFLARSFGIEAVGVVADRRTYFLFSRFIGNLREVIAHTKAIVDLYLWRPKVIN